MLQKPGQPTAPARSDIPFAEFVGLMAVMMALTALSVDIMLPALGQIGQELRLPGDNDRQLIITVYLAGFAAGQVVWGPLSDRLGRRKPLYAGLAIYVLGAVTASLADSSGLMFAARAVQGLGASAPRIIAIAIVRDRFSGREMSRVMSFVMMVFIIMPILAPALGQGVMLFGPWRLIFAVLLLACLVILVWSWLRLRETHAPDAHHPFSFRQFGAALRTILTTRQTLGYAIGFGFFLGILMSYVGSAEQIFVDLYGLGEAFPLVFGAIASVMILASVTNARLVGRLGMRRVSHAALIGFLLVCGVMALLGYPQKPPLGLFCLFIASAFFCFGLIGPNFNAMAMEPVGAIAGTASSFIGFYTTASGAFFGFLIGQSFDGTVRPLEIGFTLLGLGSLITVLIVERGRLMRPHHAAPPKPSGPAGQP